MPKILINEKDNTSPGTPGSYANYSVLIPGFMGTPTVDESKRQQPDSNGVYEFSSKQAFEDTIGFSDDEKKAGVADIEFGDGDAKEIHYGKRMAHALLNLGYTVIYVPITSILEEDGITTETFWEIFKDKASYDFRFVCHGLLETSKDFIKADYDALVARLADRDTDISKFAEIIEQNTKEDGLDDIAAAAAYEAIAGKPDENNRIWFASYEAGNGNQASFYSYTAAKEYFVADANGVIPAKKDIQDEIDALDESCVTSAVFNKVNSNITKLARYVADDPADIPGRGDCIALIELDENCYNTTTGSTRPEKLIIEGINDMAASLADDGKYCALTVPSLYYKMSGEAVKFPGSYHYLACFMSSLRAGFAEWYAVAGYTRGVSSAVVDHTSVKLGEIAINALEPRYLVDDENKVQPAFACNVIANFRGSYYLWGNRTAHKLMSAAGGGDLVASHFLNIRQLCTTIKKQLYVACRRFTFDPNSDTLWFNFVNAIAPTLDAMKADQGVRDYKIVKVYTDKKATLKAKIRIIPIEAVEDFDLEISLEDSFGETSATVTE